MSFENVKYKGEMKLVYIAGPYRSDDPERVADNISVAHHIALELASMGIGYICPHLNRGGFERWEPDVPDQFYLDLGIELLSRCDAMFVLRGWEKSQGTMAELDWWMENRMGATVFYQESSMWKVDMLDWWKKEA